MITTHTWTNVRTSLLSMILSSTSNSGERNSSSNCVSSCEAFWASCSLSPSMSYCDRIDVFDLLRFFCGFIFNSLAQEVFFAWSSLFVIHLIFAVSQAPQKFGMTHKGVDQFGKVFVTRDL